MSTERMDAFNRHNRISAKREAGEPLTSDDVDFLFWEAGRFVALTYAEDEVATKGPDATPPERAAFNEAVRQAALKHKARQMAKATATHGYTYAETRDGVERVWSAPDLTGLCNLRLMLDPPPYWFASAEQARAHAAAKREWGECCRVRGAATFLGPDFGSDRALLDRLRELFKARKAPDNKPAG